MTITVNLTDTPVGVAVSANAGAVSVSAATVTAVEVGVGAATHAHGNITSDGKIGTASGRLVMTSTGGALVAAAQDVVVNTRQLNLVAGYAEITPLTFPDFSEQFTAWTGTVAAGSVTGLAASATTDTTNATNITSGTLPEARLPNNVILHPFLLAGM